MRSTSIALDRSHQNNGNEKIILSYNIFLTFMLVSKCAPYSLRYFSHFFSVSLSENITRLWVKRRNVILAQILPFDPQIYKCVVYVPCILQNVMYMRFSFFAYGVFAYCSGTITDIRVILPFSTRISFSVTFRQFCR